MAPVLTALALASVLATPRAPSPTARSDRTVVYQPAGQPRGAPAARARVVAAARRQLGRPFGGDCSAFVRRVYADAGVPLRPSARARSGTEAIVRGLAATRRPRAGDLAYFHRTHDRDPPGRGRNLFTHVAVVESVRGERVTLIHRSNTGVQRLAMHLARRSDPELNGALRRRKASDRPGQPYLASQLLAGFATPFPQGAVVAGRKAAAPARSKPAWVARPR